MSPRAPRIRRGFTLIEMMVTIVIMAIVTGITLTAINLSLSADRVRSTGRTVQSYLLGARDRAIFAHEPRGVRFILDENDNRVVRSMIYIGPLEPAAGTLDMATDGQTLTRVSGTSWATLAGRGLLVPGVRIRVQNEPLWYTVANIAGETITLTSPHVDLAGTGATDVEFELELTAGVLPNQEPIVFTPGVVIDIDPANSRLPSTWTTFPNRMDVIFSPRGTVIGQVNTAGVIHLLLTEYSEVVQGRGIADPAKTGDELLVTLFTRTGQVSLHPVDTTGDPYLFAETGEVAP